MLTDRLVEIQDEANSRVSQFCEGVYRLISHFRCTFRSYKGEGNICQCLNAENCIA